jgi:hypothetical protein
MIWSIAARIQGSDSDMSNKCLLWVMIILSDSFTGV